MYSSTIPSPTGIASDPALAAHGVDQSRELAAHLKTLNPPIERFYSSAFYRCIETITPSINAVSAESSNPECSKVRLENGVGEWYGMARFDHPSPASLSVLKKFFPNIDETYAAVIKPSVNGETVEELHDRCAYAIHCIIEQADKEGVKVIAICTHAASLIAIGRALTGVMPEDISVEDFPTYTCGVSTFRRKSNGKENAPMPVGEWEGPESQIPYLNWRGGKGVGGGWEMTVAGDCSFLSGGQERGW